MKKYRDLDWKILLLVVSLDKKRFLVVKNLYESDKNSPERWILPNHGKLSRDKKPIDSVCRLAEACLGTKSNKKPHYIWSGQDFDNNLVYLYRIYADISLCGGFWAYKDYDVHRLYFIQAPLWNSGFSELDSEVLKYSGQIKVNETFMSTPIIIGGNPNIPVKKEAQ